jgi:prenyl protein peptidase
VLPFYLSRTTRPSPTLNRDAPTVIRARIRSVSLACLVSTLSTIYLINHQSNKSTSSETIHLLGYSPFLHPFTITTITSTLLQPLLLTFTLFLGPLYESLLIHHSYTHWFTHSNPNSLPSTLSSAIGFRNYIAGPLTEELLFRSTIIPIHLLANTTPTKIIFLTPLYFGIAHIHHFYEFTLTHPYTPILPALLRSLFQLTYTTLFGWYAAFLYLRTGSLVTVVLVHSFCNWCGLPRVWGRVGANELVIGPPAPTAVPAGAANGKDKGDDDDDDDNDDDDDVRHLRCVGQEGKAPGVAPTVAYYLLLFAGAYGFAKGLWPLTESSNALASVG